MDKGAFTKHPGSEQESGVIPSGSSVISKDSVLSDNERCHITLMLPADVKPTDRCVGEGGSNIHCDTQHYLK